MIAGWPRSGDPRWLAGPAGGHLGVSTPLVQRFGAGLEAFTTAALLYASAAAVGAFSRWNIERETPVVRGIGSRLLPFATVWT
jgi:hypothetical protein